MSARRKILIITSAVLVMIALPITMHFRAKWRLENYKKELIARGEKLTIAELIPPPKEGPNGMPALLLFAVDLPSTNHATLMQYIESGVARIAWKEDALAPAYGLNPEVNLWPVYRDIWETNQQAFKELHAALESPVLDMPLDYYQGFGLLLPHLAPMTYRARLLSAMTLLHLHDGNSEGAFEQWRALMRLGSACRNERLIISHLVRMNISHTLFRATWEALQYPDWGDAKLLEIQHLWEDLEYLEPFISAIAMEAAISQESYALARSDYGQWKTMLDFAPGAPPPPTDFDQILQETFTDFGRALKGFSYRFPGYPLWKSFWSYGDERLLWERSQELLQAVRQSSREERPIREALEILKAKDAAFEELFADSPRFMGVRSFNYSRDRTLIRLLNAQALKEMAGAAIALHRFRLANGRFPDELAELVPVYVSQLPRDPFAGDTLRYRLQPDGRFLLYSVGEDCVDNGGDPTPRSISEYFIEGRDLVWPAPATPEQVAAHRAKSRD